MISKTEFVKVLENMQRCDKFNDELNAILKKYDGDGFIYVPDCVDEVVFLLADMMDDTDMLVGKWCFDLQYGKGLKNGSLRRNDGTPVEVKDAGGLYDYLVAAKSGEGDTDTKD